MHKTVTLTSNFYHVVKVLFIILKKITFNLVKCLDTKMWIVHEPMIWTK